MPNVVLILLPVATEFPSHLLGLHSISLLLGVIEKSPSERARQENTQAPDEYPHTHRKRDLFFIDSAFSYIVQFIPSAGPGLSNTAARRSQIHAIACWLNRKKDPMSRKKENPVWLFTLFNLICAGSGQRVKEEKKYSLTRSFLTLMQLLMHHLYLLIHPRSSDDVIERLLSR